MQTGKELNLDKAVNTMKNVFIVLALACSLTAMAQTDDKAAAVKALVESQNFVFRAYTALPLDGQVRNLSTDYAMTISADRVTSDLPYFGKAYTAVDPSKGAMDFTSKKFYYKMTQRKNGDWAVTIKPEDLELDVRQIYIDITKAGYATLRVISSNRDAISYTGAVGSPN
jgi:hypothetical protein